MQERVMTRRTSAYWPGLAQMVASTSEDSYRACAVALVGVFGLLVVILLVLGAPPIGNPWDVMMLLDAGWRMFSGQIAHIDFDNPLGPLTYLLILVGMRAGGPSTAAITYGTVIMLVVMAPWAWFIARSRFPASMAFVFTLLIGFLLIAPRPLSQPIHETSYAMYYNREGYVLLALLLVSLLLEPQRPHDVRWSALSNGLLLGLLLYCKITYFIAGGACVAFAFVLSPRLWRMVPGIVLGIVAVGVFFRFAVHIDLREYLIDVFDAGKAQSMGMRMQLLWHDLVNDAAPAYILLMFTVLWSVSFRSAPGIPWKPLLVTSWIIAIAPVVDSGNSAQRIDVQDPLYFVGGLILLELYRRRSLDRPVPRTLRYQSALLMSLLLLVPLVAGPILFKDMASVAYAAEWNLVERAHFDPSRKLHSDQLQDFLVPESTPHISSYWLARDHSANINDGIDLLKRNLQPGDRVTTMAFTNPFSFALGIAPAKDGPQWWDQRINFDENHHPTAETFLGDCSLVIVPLKVGPNAADFGTVELMQRLYGGYLQANFTLVDQSERWQLYRRRV